MANLIGYVKDEHKSNATRQSRTSSTLISAQLETWHGAIRTELDRDGNFTVYVGGKENPSAIIARGNVGNVSEKLHVTERHVANYRIDGALRSVDEEV